jgi:hypothetical protein
LGQFSLLGDPSIHPAAVRSPTSVPKGIDVQQAKRLERRARRAKMRAEGELLQETKPTASRKARGVRKSTVVRKALANIARQAGIGTRKEFASFVVKTPKGARLRGGKAAPTASRYYVAISSSRKAKAPPHPMSVAAVAKEVAGRIVGYRIYEAKSWATAVAVRKK